jgi:outer membrane protein assembly factor BamE (lipoprotein component of BamABCDE complex)
MAADFRTSQMRDTRRPMRRIIAPATFHRMLRMKKMIIPLLFAACFIFTGCASKTPRDAQTHKTNLGRVRLGMTTKKVSALVGPPIRVEKKVTAAPTTVEWFYVESQFMLAGDGVVTGLQEYGDTRNGQRVIKLTFTDDRLFSIERMRATP